MTVVQRPPVVTPEMIFAQLYRHYTLPREPAVLHLSVTRADVHRIFSTDHPQSRLQREKFPLSETTIDVKVMPGSVEVKDRQTRDLSGELVPWDIAVTPKKR